MPVVQNLTPEQQQAVAAFKAKYPNIPPGGRLLEAWMGGHPEAQKDTEALSQILGVAQDYGLNPGTMSVQKTDTKKATLIRTLAIVGGAALGGVAATGGFAGAAPAAAGTGTSAGTGAAGATSAYGPLAGGYGAATTEAAVPASLAAGGSGAAAGAGAATTAYGPFASGLSTDITVPSSIAAEGGAGATAAAPSIWDRIFGKTATDKALTGIGIGANLAGSIIQSRQASKAAEAEKEAADKALVLQSNIYQQQRSDLAPYRNAGASSLSALTYGLGLDPSKSADTTTPYFAQQAQAQNTAAQQSSQAQNRMPPAAPSQAVPRASLSAISAPAANGFVNMVSPDGRPARVPQNQVQAAMAAGGRLA